MLEIDSINKIKKMLPALDTGFLEQEEFKDFYKVKIIEHDGFLCARLYA